MANRQLYTDAQGADVWVPGLGSIWLVRDNKLEYDYSDGLDTNSTQEQYGDALKTALGDMTTGDRLYVGPGKFQVDNADFTAAEAAVYFQGTLLRPLTTAYNWIFRMFGERQQLWGLTVDGAGFVGSSTATSGIRVEKQYNQVKNCTAVNIIGSTFDSGIGFYMANGFSTQMDGCRADRNHYCAVRAANNDGVAIQNCMFVDNGNQQLGSNQPRTIQIDGSLQPGRYLRLENNLHFCSEANRSSYINISQAQKIDEVLISGCEIVDGGANLNIDSRIQLLKIQDVGRMCIYNNVFRHPENAFANREFVGLAFDPNAGDELDCVDIVGNDFSGAIQLPSKNISGYVNIRENRFCIDHNENQVCIENVGNYPLLNIENNRFNMTLGRRIFNFRTEVVPTANVFRFVGNIFIGTVNASGSPHMNLADSAGTGLFTNPRKIICHDNFYNNASAGDFRLSNWEDLGSRENYLYLSTDANGDLLYDSSDPGMPTPQGGADAFPGLPGRFGQQIIDKSNSTTGWMYSGTEWKARL